MTADQVRAAGAAVVFNVGALSVSAGFGLADMVPAMGFSLAITVEALWAFWERLGGEL